MILKLNRGQITELRKRVDEVLYYVWDPIGVKDVPEARGEYSSYVHLLMKDVMEGDANAIVEKLAHFEVAGMGLSHNDQSHNKYVAERLIDFRDAILGGLW